MVLVSIDVETMSSLNLNVDHMTQVAPIKKYSIGAIINHLKDNGVLLVFLTPEAIHEKMPRTVPAGHMVKITDQTIIPTAPPNNTTWENDISIGAASAATSSAIAKSAKTTPSINSKMSFFIVKMLYSLEFMS